MKRVPTKYAVRWPSFYILFKNELCSYHVVVIYNVPNRDFGAMSSTVSPKVCIFSVLQPSDAEYTNAPVGSLVRSVYKCTYNTKFLFVQCEMHSGQLLGCF